MLEIKDYDFSCYQPPLNSDPFFESPGTVGGAQLQGGGGKVFMAGNP